jgi:hypothetical protein
MTDATDDRVEPAAADRIEPQQERVEPEAAADVAPAESAPDAMPPFTTGERVGRGLALALLVIPAGVIVWTIIWNLGFIASIVSWGVAVGAVWLYRMGSKARITRGAFWGIISIVVVTVVLSLLAGMFTDLVAAIDLPLQDAITDPRVWGAFADNLLTNGEMWQAYVPQVLMALVFAFLGCFWTLRRVSRESRA